MYNTDAFVFYALYCAV